MFRREADIGQVLTLQGSNPDFLVETPDRIRFLLELKSVGEEDTLLDRIDPSVRTFSIDPMSLQKRANRLVRDAAKQLAPYAPEAAATSPSYASPQIAGSEPRSD